MEPRVTFAPGLASDVVKPSRPSRKIPTEKDYGPLAYAIILPRRVMLPRLAESDPDIIENVDLAKVWAQSNAIEASLENMCDEARKIWPDTFGCIVDPTFEDGSCYALGFADNTRPENDSLPTKVQIQQIRERLRLTGEDYRLCWFEELYPWEYRL
ncbi:uncharacterized protein C8R40DRAFT_1176824 [Lentinula edodes]|uniref:uncharacterized protein n=1 Tax=Lentinula edodes TaxID=5353 RepID=UPI001E8D35BC|nr:uncharacterized protein C8R40DRAFT_1176824 [Lentinula edodes]KAH7869326.1 hypothetical protein C8R40DRAFT_1176824 [Lentinula edodes]